MALRGDDQEGRTERERMIRRLYEVSLSGSLSSLVQLIEEDELILDRVMVTYFNQTPLHIAAIRDHLEFAREILKRKPELASELDSESCSPLHLASGKGNLEMVKELLRINPDVCRVTNSDGLTPLHLAAIKGRIDVMKELIQARPEVIHDRVDRGESILQLCVRYNQLKALELLLESTASNQQAELLNSKDDDGNTVLHLATAKKQTKVIELLLGKNGIEINAVNKNGVTALDMLAQSVRDIKDMDIAESLRAAGALKARDIISITDGVTNDDNNNNNGAATTKGTPGLSSSGADHHDTGDWLASQKNSLMVVSTVIAAMAYQAMLSPPNADFSEPISAYYYKRFIATNIVAFVGSLVVTLLLVSGLSLKRRFFVWLLMGIIWIVIASSVDSYFSSVMILVIPQSGDFLVIGRVLSVGSTDLVGVMLLIFSVHSARLLTRFSKSQFQKEANSTVVRLSVWVPTLVSIINLCRFAFQHPPPVMASTDYIRIQTSMTVLYVIISLGTYLLLFLYYSFIFMCTARGTLKDKARQQLRWMMMIIVNTYSNRNSGAVV